MDYYGIFLEDKRLLVCGSKEKAEEMVLMYPGADVFPVEEVNNEWVKKKAKK